MLYAFFLFCLLRAPQSVQVFRRKARPVRVPYLLSLVFFKGASEKIVPIRSVDIYTYIYICVDDLVLKPPRHESPQGLDTNGYSSPCKGFILRLRQVSIVQHTIPHQVYQRAPTPQTLLTNATGKASCFPPSTSMATRTPAEVQVQGLIRKPF